MPGPPRRLPDTMPQPSIPASLTPGRPQTRPIWNNSATPPPSSLYGPVGLPYSSPHRSSLYGDYLFSTAAPPVSPPPLPQKPPTFINTLPTAPAIPPIPPKPQALAISSVQRNPLYPTSIPGFVVGPVAGPSSQPIDNVEPIADSPVDDKDIALAMALSASEARQREEALIAQEEEDFARALEESRLISTPYPIDEGPSLPQSYFATHRSLSADRVSTSAIKGSAHPPEGESWLHLITPTASQYSSQDSELPSPHSPHPSVDRTESINEPNEPAGSTSDDVRDLQFIRDTGSPTPPLYAGVVSNLLNKHPSTSSTIHSPNLPSSSSSIQSFNLPSSSSIISATYPSSEDNDPSSPHPSSIAQSSASDHVPLPPFASRPSWASSNISEGSGSTGRSSNGELLSPVSGGKSPPGAPASPNLSFVSSASLDPLDEEIEDEDDNAPGQAARPLVPLSANQYVEPEMLIGVSLGFARPVISIELTPMAGLMPNVITLPYGKAPAFHIQAPSWRRLLKLMARLSATRVEPTLEALTLAKHELKLRTVIQFVKIHHSASEWRTVLYLTTDSPVPAAVPNSHKYTNGDVSVLPFSYTLSPLPTLLRDGAESPMAKYYVVPSTPSTPYPTLPINFPNLAMYLQSAVQDSRRAVSDSSSGVRKLANYIDNCYQNEAETAAPIDEGLPTRRGVGGMFKRVIGRNKGSSSKGSRGNEEIYELVTPFVPDEWG
ncbi:hypothetical protein HYDPIDRAFT_104777 [Hydnomerulius pinastri MD-312]|nr:hypothetical protein HYDPIDRAFT_104777 [Hydnomerulius pinastri MD-312]